MPAIDFTTCRNNFSADKLLKTLQNAEEQYPPLKADEEKAIIKEYLAAGREEELRNKLAMHHIRYCYKLAGKYSKTTVDFDEMIGNAIEGLFIAASKFDFSKGVRFITYAQPYIFRGIMHEYYDDTQNAVNAGVPLDRPILSDEPGGEQIISVIDRLSSNSLFNDSDDRSGKKAAIDLDRECFKNILTDTMKYLRDAPDFNDFDRYIFVKGIVGGTDMKSISELSGVPYYMVNKRKAEILDLLRNHIKDKFNMTSVDSLF